MRFPKGKASKQASLFAQSTNKDITSMKGKGKG